ncbi:MAG: hypothetical protein ABI579_04990 [Candidatus Sumerlaeota bacterium]
MNAKKESFGISGKPNPELKKWQDKLQYYRSELEKATDPAARKALTIRVQQCHDQVKFFEEGPLISPTARANRKSLSPFTLLFAALILVPLLVYAWPLISLILGILLLIIRMPNIQ